MSPPVTCVSVGVRLSCQSSSSTWTPTTLSRCVAASASFVPNQLIVRVTEGARTCLPGLSISGGQVQQGQTGTSVAYATPIEYLITPEVGDCFYDQQSAETRSNSAREFQQQVYGRHAGGLAPVAYSRETTSSNSFQSSSSTTDESTQSASATLR